MLFAVHACDVLGHFKQACLNPQDVCQILLRLGQTSPSILFVVLQEEAAAEDVPLASSDAAATQEEVIAPTEEAAAVSEDVPAASEAAPAAQVGAMSKPVNESDLTSMRP